MAVCTAAPTTTPGPDGRTAAAAAADDDDDDDEEEEAVGLEADAEADDAAAEEAWRSDIPAWCLSSCLSELPTDGG